MVFLLPSSVNYRHKAFSGLSSCTIHVLLSRLSLETLVFLVSNKNDNIVNLVFMLFLRYSHLTYASDYEETKIQVPPVV